ncbi:MAG: gliding motility-associated C-terminal domain-containing protein [Saprospiraceae bacterium]
MKLVTRHCFLIGCLLFTLSLRAGSIFPTDSIVIETYDCTGTTNVCVGIPATDLGSFTLIQDGAPYFGSINGCNFDTTVTYTYNTLLGLGTLGPYHLDSWVVNGQVFNGEFLDIPALVDMLNVWDPQGNWVHEPNSLSISGGAPGKSYSNMEVTVMMNNTPSTIGMNFGLLPQGTEMAFAEGTHTLVAIDNANGLQDTLTVVVVCLSLPTTQTFSDTIQANGFPFVLCLDTTQLPGNVTSIENACPGQSGQFVSFYLDTVNYCLKYSGIKCGGTESACVVICDDTGLCDTTNVTVTVDFSLCAKSSQKWNDTLVVNFTKTLCIDTTALPGVIQTVDNLCPGESGQSVVFEYDETTHCVTYTGIAPGLDQGCFLLTDEFGNTDTAYVCIYVRLPESGIILDTLLLGQSQTYCMDASELAGNVVNIENFCPAFPANEVSFAVDALNLCVDVQSLTVGTDTACIFICDDYGVCDTTYLYVTVMPDVANPCANSLPPVANNDLASTLLNTPVNVDILSNDDLGNCQFITIAILDEGNGGGPRHGLTVLNPNQTVDFVPDLDFCGLDTFEYVLCSPAGCDTAMVLLNVNCTPLDSVIIYNGISPNGDGVNDSFTIENIEQFPDNELRVYNRWGNLVFRQQGYQNTWNGKYRSSDLPDGSYFYLLTLGDGREFSGFLQIHR